MQIRIIQILSKILRKISFCFYRFQFESIGNGSVINKNITISNRKRIRLGKNVILFSSSRIELIREYEGVEFNPKLIIGDNSQIHQNCHLTCAEQIEIGKNVVIVSNVTITDIIHPHDNVKTPINKAKIKTDPVIIEDEVYIYNNSVILPGVKIGKHAIIGANSVVTNDIPSYSIAVGSPAKVIKKFNFETNSWERIN